MIRNVLHIGTVVVNYFLRLVFQDGQRKRRQRYQVERYHGRGSPHIHAVIWTHTESTSTLRTAVSATLSNTSNEMKCLIEGCQSSHTGSGWPIRSDENAWDAERQWLFLKHTSTDHRKGIRALMPDVLSTLRCRMDVSVSDGRGMLSRYCAGHVPNCFHRLRPNDDANASAATRRVLDDCAVCGAWHFCRFIKGDKRKAP